MAGIVMDSQQLSIEKIFIKGYLNQYTHPKNVSLMSPLCSIQGKKSCQTGISQPIGGLPEYVKDMSNTQSIRFSRFYLAMNEGESRFLRQSGYFPLYYRMLLQLVREQKSQFIDFLCETCFLLKAKYIPEYTTFIQEYILRYIYP